MLVNTNDEGNDIEPSVNRVQSRGIPQYNAKQGQIIKESIAKGTQQQNVIQLKFRMKS